MNDACIMTDVPRRIDERQRPAQPGPAEGDSVTMDEGARRPDWVGRGIGLAVFAGGIILLVVVFFWIGRLQQPVLPAGDVKLDRWLAQGGLGLLVEVARLVMSGLVASWIASRGAQMYAAAGRIAAGDRES